LRPPHFEDLTGQTPSRRTSGRLLGSWASRFSRRVVPVRTARDTAVQIATIPVPFIKVRSRVRVFGVRSVHATSRIRRWCGITVVGIR